jgi:hypothetical protein
MYVRDEHINGSDLVIARCSCNYCSIIAGTQMYPFALSTITHGIYDYVYQRKFIHAYYL